MTTAIFQKATKILKKNYLYGTHDMSIIHLVIITSYNV